MSSTKVIDILSFIDDQLLSNSYINDFYPDDLDEECEEWVLHHFLEAIFETYDDNSKLFCKCMEILSSSPRYCNIFRDTIIKIFLDTHEYYNEKNLYCLKLQYDKHKN